MNEKQIITDLTRAEKDAQTIRQRDEQIKRLTADLDEYRKAEEVMIAAGLISKHKVEQAHEIVGRC